MDDFWKAVGGWAAVIAVSTWIVKEAAKRWLDRESEDYKQQLKKAADMELEGFRVSLRQEAFRHEKRFGLLHDELFRSLKEIHPPLFEFYLSVEKYVAWIGYSDDPPMDEKLQNVSERWNQFREIYKKNMILIPEDLHRKIDDLTRQMRGTADDFTSGRRKQEQGQFEAKHWTDSAESLRRTIKPLLDEVKGLAQKLMGHESLRDDEVRS